MGQIDRVGGKSHLGPFLTCSFNLEFGKAFGMIVVVVVVVVSIYQYHFIWFLLQVRYEMQM